MKSGPICIPSFAATAREEGFPEIAAVMENIAIAEKQHEKQYRSLWQHLTDGTMFKRGDKVIWRCRNCGFIYEGTEAPKACLLATTLRPISKFCVININ